MMYPCVFAGAVDFRDVVFGYNFLQGVPARDPVLKGVSFGISGVCVCVCVCVVCECVVLWVCARTCVVSEDI